MNVREELSKYNYYLAKISKIEMDINILRNEINLKSPVIDGLPRASGSVNSNEEKIIRNIETINYKESLIQENKDKLKLIDNLIKTLKENQQKIIKARFIENLDIKTIADNECKEYRTVQANIDTAINIMQENLDRIC